MAAEDKSASELSSGEALQEMRAFAAERAGNGLSDPEDAWWYQACFVRLDGLMRAGDMPTEWRAPNETGSG